MSKKQTKARKASRAQREFARETLIAVAGLTPQVITETIYALSKQSPPVLVDEVHVVTTAVGAAKVREELLGPKSALDRFVADYAPGHRIRLDDDTIHVVKCGSATLDDIRDIRGNREMADLIFRQVRDLAADRDRRIHGTIAGGRKTMGFYLGYAFSLNARTWDRLSHVLVDPPYENHPDFFYPTRRPTWLPLKDGDPADASQARVHLAEIPFVALRDLIPPAAAEPARFDSIVKDLQGAVDQQRKLQVSLDLTQRKLQVGQTSIGLTPEQAVIYAHYMRNKRLRCVKPEFLTCEACDACYLEIGQSEAHRTEMRRDAEIAFPRRGSFEKPLDDQEHRAKLSKLNRTLGTALGGAAALLQVRTLKRRYASTRYGIAADRDRLHINGTPDIRTGDHK